MTLRRYRAVILPVVLLVLVLLGLLVAMFSLRVNADLASTRAVALRLQTRLAAEAGIDRVKLLLRDARFDMDQWYDNLDELHRIVVWSVEGDQTVWGSNDEFEDPTAMTYRFSIVADDLTDDEDFVRFGVTDESSKLNLNTATEAQLLRLVRAAVEGDTPADAKSIVDAILDWRDADRVTRGGAGDTEGEYYRRLSKPYAIKNGPFDTVEELLLVKGVTGGVLYGEDWDRNGLLTPNEDDGDLSFPPDDENGRLNPGLYPYLTVLSSENNVSNDNRRRVYLFDPEPRLREGLAEVFPDDPAIVDFIVVAVRSGRGGTGNTGNGGSAPGTGDADPADSTDSNDGALSREEGEEPAGDRGGEGEGQDAEGDAGQSAERNDDQAADAPIRCPASLLRERTAAGQRLRRDSPLSLEHLPVLMDRTTTIPPDQRSIPGLININTAPRLVLETIEGLTPEQIDSILDMRERLGPETKSTTAWLLTEEVVDMDTFEQIAPSITARGQQFMIESLGYADHRGMVTRLQVVVDMVGPIAQTVYYRDLTSLGGHYPIREDDLEKLRGR